MTALETIKKNTPDIKLETLVLLLDLIPEEGATDLVIQSLGSFQRAFSKEIELVNLKKRIISIHRNGLYDLLPEGIFHPMQKGETAPFKSAKNIVSEIKQHRKETEAARQYFLPFEQSFFHYRLLMEKEECNAYKHFGNHPGLPLFKLLCGPNKLLTNEQKLMVFYLLPQLKSRVGNWKLCQMVLSTFINEKVAVKKYNNLKTELASRDDTVLNSTILGVDSILGKQVIDYDESLFVQIGPLENHSLLYFLGEGEGRQIIHFLSDYLFPFEMDVIINVLAPKRKEDFLLTKDTAIGRLGYSTIIK